MFFLLILALKFLYLLLNKMSAVRQFGCISIYEQISIVSMNWESIAGVKMFHWCNKNHPQKEKLINSRQSTLQLKLKDNFFDMVLWAQTNQGRGPHRHNYCTVLQRDAQPPPVRQQFHLDSIIKSTDIETCFTESDICGVSQPCTVFYILINLWISVKQGQVKNNIPNSQHHMRHCLEHQVKIETVLHKHKPMKTWLSTWTNRWNKEYERCSQEPYGISGGSA